MKKKITSLILALTIVMSLTPITANAETNNELGDFSIQNYDKIYTNNYGSSVTYENKEKEVYYYARNLVSNNDKEYSLIEYDNKTYPNISESDLKSTIKRLSFDIKILEFSKLENPAIDLKFAYFYKFNEQDYDDNDNVINIPVYGLIFLSNTNHLYNLVSGDTFNDNTEFTNNLQNLKYIDYKNQYDIYPLSDVISWVTDNEKLAGNAVSFKLNKSIVKTEKKSNKKYTYKVKTKSSNKKAKYKDNFYIISSKRIKANKKYTKMMSKTKVKTNKKNKTINYYIYVK